MIRRRPSAILISILIHLLLVLSMSPGHDQEHTVQLFKGFIELGESGDGHATRPHVHSKPKEVQKASRDQEKTALSSGAPSNAAVDISTPILDGSAGSNQPLSEGELYLFQVLKKIRGLQAYPRDSLLKEEEGTVRVGLTILENGSVDKIELTRPCPFQSLNESALRSVQAASPFPALPKIWKHAIRIQIPIHYELSSR